MPGPLVVVIQSHTKKKAVYDCNTHTTAMQKNALRVSLLFQPRALARKPGPTERPGSGLSWLRSAPNTGERPPPSDGVRQQGLHDVGDDGRRFPSKRRGCWQSLASALSQYSCTCCLLALLALNMPQNEPTHRTGTLRFDCIFQTCHTEDGVAIFKHATNKAATRSTKTCWNVLRPRQTQSSHTYCACIYITKSWSILYMKIFLASSATRWHCAYVNLPPNQ